MNKKGFTLIEVLTVLIILGIIIQVLMSLNAMLGFTVKRSLAAVQKVQQANVESAALKLKWTNQPLTGTYTTILCFTGNATYSCMPNGCNFTDTWNEGGHKCTAGILYY